VSTSTHDGSSDVWNLSRAEKQVLVHVARDAIAVRLGASSVGDPYPIPERLLESGSAFVSIKIGGQLRGCIGNLNSPDSLLTCVKEMAVAAASRDHRFQSIQPQELARVSLEISVLSPMEEIGADITSEFTIGTHGLYIVRDQKSGLLLPQVAVEYGWNPEEFLNQTCTKAGLDKTAWKQGCQIYKFRAEIFVDEGG